jgi:hypothetical protein
MKKCEEYIVDGPDGEDILTVYHWGDGLYSLRGHYPEREILRGGADRIHAFIHNFFWNIMVVC